MYESYPNPAILFSNLTTKEGYNRPHNMSEAHVGQEQQKNNHVNKLIIKLLKQVEKVVDHEQVHYEKMDHQEMVEEAQMIWQYQQAQKMVEEHDQQED